MFGQSGGLYYFYEAAWVKACGCGGLYLWNGAGCLVTDSAGFIASHLVASLVRLRANVTVAADLSNGFLENTFEVWTAHATVQKRVVSNTI